MIRRGRRNVLGVMVDVVDYDAAVDAVISAAEDGRPFALSALAVHGVMTGFDDAEHRHRLNSLDMITPDGQPVRWALRFLHGEALPDRVYGPELTRRVCSAAAERGLPVFLYGSTEEVLADLAPALERDHPGLRVAGARPSLFRPANDDAEQREIAQAIVDSGARICLVGLGCPRQEVFAAEMRDLVGMPLLAVGAAFDFHAGHAAEPPMWVQRAGLQWLQRLLQEPRRLWRRYLVLNPRYVAAVVRQRGGRAVSPVGADPQPMRFA